MNEFQALKRAIAALDGPANVGRLFGISSQAVSQWKRVPATRVKALAEATGGAVPASDLRPDIFTGEVA